MPDTGLVGDQDDPGRRAVTLPSRIYEAADRAIGPREAATIARAQQRVRVGIESQLSRLENGRDSGQDAAEYRRVTEALRREPDRGTNRLLLEHAEIAWNAVHDPALIADVVSRLYGESLRRPGSGGLDPLTKAVLRAAAVGGPIHIVPPKSMVGDLSFFRNWIATGRRFLDLGIDTEAHGHTTHLIQGLIVDEAFKRAGVNMTNARFRQLLAGAESNSVNGPGNLLWIRMFDGIDGINKPEILMPALRLIPGLEGLR